MKSSNLKTYLFAATTLGCAVLPALCPAQTFTYHVDVNVAALIADPGTAPYYLDFQLNGDGLPAAATNTVTLSGFTFTAGGASGSPVHYGNASGNLNSVVILSLDANDTANELYQGFTDLTTDIQFNVTSTENGSGITPDLFLVAILDNSTGQIATNAPDTVSLVSESINGPTTPASVRAYHSTSPAGVVATVVPEPTTLASVLAALGGLALIRRRQRS